MTAPPTRRDDGQPAASHVPSRLGISFIQVVAAALAAITATVVASFFGVAGTVIGAGISSVFTVVGTAVYGHSLRRTRERMRVVVPVGRHRGPAPTPAGAPVRPPRPTYPLPPSYRETTDGYGPVRYSSRRRWPLATRLVFGTVLVFAAVLGVVTAVEVVAQRPMSDLVRGNDTVSGTTLFGSRQHTPGRAHRQSSAPTRPSATVTRTLTRTASPSQPVTTRSEPSGSSPTAPSSSPASSTTASPSSADQSAAESSLG